MSIKRLILGLVQCYGALSMRRMRSALQSPERVQRRVLKRIVREMKKTEYGKHYGVTDIADFKSALPLVNYDDLKPWVEKQKRYEDRALVGSPVIFYEKTSGSTSAQKYIPYTSPLRRAFTHLFLLWFYDLIKQIPGLKNGKGTYYISVSPNFDPKETTEMGVAVSLETDADYLGSLWKRLLSSFLVMVEGIDQIKDPERFKEALAIRLLQQEDLEVISIWNPSFLMVLLDWIVEHQQRLLDALASALPSNRQERLVSLLAAPVVDWSEVWPNLKLISCWSDATAHPLANRLSQMMPKVMIQGKGLLATEAPITFPLVGKGLVGKEGGVPLLTNMYLEFIDSDKEGTVRELHQLELNAIYELVITNISGLYRYRLGDRVQVVGWEEKTPRLRFIGRTSQVCDLVGEKLNETFVMQTITALNLVEMSSSFLLAVREPKEGYVLVIDAKNTATHGESDPLAERLEQGLAEAYHYRHARALGQLTPARVVRVQHLDQVLARYAMSAGKRLGGVKHRFLVPPDLLLSQTVLVGDCAPSLSQ